MVTSLLFLFQSLAAVLTKIIIITGLYSTLWAEVDLLGNNFGSPNPHKNENGGNYSNAND
jgi:hypothetical protein